MELKIQVKEALSTGPDRSARITIMDLVSYAWQISNGMVGPCVLLVSPSRYGAKVGQARARFDKRAF